MAEGNLINNRFTCDDVLAEKLVNGRDTNNYVETNLTAELPVRDWNYRNFTRKKNLVVLESQRKPTIVLNAKDKALACLVDSGSDRCLIKYETLQRLEDNPEINQSQLRVRGIAGDSRVVGETKLEIMLPETGNVIEVMALVLRDMNYKGHIILGNDLLRKSKSVIDYAKETITIDGIVLPFVRKETDTKNVPGSMEEHSIVANLCTGSTRKKRKNHTRKVKEVGSNKKITYTVHLASDVTLEAKSMTTICGHTGSFAGQYVVKNRTDHKGYLVAQSLCNIEEDGRVPMCILNPTSEEIFLSEGSGVATLEESNFCESAVLIQNMEEELKRTQNVEDIGKTTETLTTGCESSKLEGAAKELELKDVNVGSEPEGGAKEELIKLLNKYRSVISLKGEGIGKTKLLKHRIELVEKNLTVNTPPYRIPHKFQALLDIELASMKEQGLIRDSISPFNSPVLVVHKKSGEIRPVIDFRNVNKNIFVNSFALPRIDDILNSVGEAKYFSTLDLKSAFHHIELEEDSKPITAFSVGNHKYEFNVLPFGLSTSPSVFQALMSRCLGEVLGMIAFCYLDDIIIFSKSISDHLEHLEIVLDKIKQANLRVKLEKCEFLKNRVNYLGYIISSEGITYETNSNIEKATPPTDVKSLQTYLGFVNYFRRFIPQFSVIASPLYSLLQKDKVYEWTPECDEAFRNLQELVNQKPVLSHPDYEKPFYVFSDASGSGLGGCLMQAVGESKVLKPILYFSKTLSKTQRRYSTTKREALALVSAIRQFRYIITGYPTYVFTDHRPLVFMFKRKLPPDAAMARWCLALQGYPIELKYYPGKLNVIADYLSRITVPLEEQDMVECETLSRSLDSRNESEEEDVEVCDSLVTDSGSKVDNDKPLSAYIPTLEEVSWSVSELKEAQSNDAVSKEVILSIKGESESSSNIKNLDSYLLIGDILYKRRKLDDNHLIVLNVVIPEALMNKAIKAVHYTSHNDHVHTLFKFQFRYFNPNEKALIRNYVKECEVCKLIKGRSPKPIKLKTALPTSKPFQAVSMDFLGPLPVTDSGNKYILVIIDLFTRFCVLKCVSSKHSETVIECLRDTFDVFGYPDQLLSDNALEFTSSAMQNFASINSVRKTEVLSYSAYSNGIVERNNSKILNLLKLYVNSVSSNWDQYISTAANTINNSLNETLSDTPAFTLFGHDTVPNIQRTELRDIYNFDSPEQLVIVREKFNNNVRELIHSRLVNEKKKQLLKKNFHRKDRTVEVGDRVLVRNQAKRKLDLNYFGPGTVLESNNHKIKVEIGKNILSRVNINRIIKL